MGLETSYYRIDGKNALFFEVDLHEVIELREKYFEPGLIFQYFHEKDVAEFIENVKDIFENAEMIFEAANRFGNIYCSFYVKRTGNKSARMYFYIEDEFAQKVNCQLIECRGFYKDTLRMLDKKWGYIQELP